MSRPIRDMIRKAMQATCPIRVFFGFDELDDLIQHRKDKTPFVFLDHAYFNRGYDRYNFRAVYNGIHLTRVLDVPAPRFKTAHLCGWRQGDEILFIPAASNPIKFHGDQGWNDRVLQVLARSDRKVVIKSKKDGQLPKYLKHAWCLITHSSVAGVEAVVSGVPVFGPETSPAFPVGNPDLNDIEHPLFPDRQQWINSLSYAQYTLDEIKNGTAWSVINEHFHLRRA